MLDFCLAIPYGLALALGGVAGFASKGSLPSLIAGTGSGGALLAIARASMKHHKETGRQSAATAMASLAVSAVVTMAMAKRYHDTGKVMPAGVVGAMSLAMDAFFLWCVSRAASPPKGGGKDR